MKYLWVLVLVACVAMFSACGGNSSNNNGVNVNGSWSAALYDSGGNPQLTFTTSLVQSGNNGISVQNLTFTTNSACFVDGGSATGALVISGDTSGVTSAGVQLTVTSVGSSAGNTLMLNGTFKNSTINGTWTLNGGVGCNGNGTFTMTRVS
jgi:hypothetical protein